MTFASGRQLYLMREDLVFTVIYVGMYQIPFPFIHLSHYFLLIYLCRHVQEPLVGVEASNNTSYFLIILAMAQSALVPAIQALSSINCPQGKILTKPFLQLCTTILPVLDKLGPTMAVIRADIGGNIQRLDDMYESSKSEYAFLYEIVGKEALEGTAKKAMSCTRAVLWLTRAMEFMIVLLRALVEQAEWSLKEAVEFAYTATLKQWHGWISTAASNVGLKLIPEKQNFIKVLGDSTNFKEDVDKLSASLSPLLQANHAFLKSLRLDRMKSS